MINGDGPNVVDDDDEEVRENWPPRTASGCVGQFSLRVVLWVLVWLPFF